MLRLPRPVNTRAECGVRTMIYAECGEMILRCTLPPHVTGSHYDAAFSWTWSSHEQPDAG